MCELEQLVADEVVLTLPAPGHFGEACIAMDQYFRDEFGVEPELWEGGGLFDVVAVPDDVAKSAPRPLLCPACWECISGCPVCKDPAAAAGSRRP